jgi:uncharacterized repeat protein (TIGR01451 family)
MEFSQKLLIVLTFLSFSIEKISAQQVGAKDCFEAITLSNINTSTFINSVGEGIYTDEINPAASCLSTGEQNSAWFKFNVASSGLLFFNLIPQCTNFVDLDWAVYDITNGGCEAIATNYLTEVSCNFSSNTFPPITGANGGDGAQDEPPIVVSDGMTLVLLVNNFSGNIENCEYLIDLSNSTAQLGNFNKISGAVNYDINDVCDDEFQVPVHNQRIDLLNENNEIIGTTYSNEDGNYNITIPSGPGLISVKIADTSEPFEPSCFPSQSTAFFTSDSLLSINNVDFALRAAQICTQYDFEYTPLFFKRCSTNVNFARIANRGTTSSPIDFTLTYPSDQVYPISSSIPFENFGSNKYLFHAPAIDINQELIVSIQDTTTCQYPFNSIICVEGELVNTNNCINENEKALKIALFKDPNSNQIVVKNFGETAMPNFYTLYINNDYYFVNNSFQTSNSYSFLLQANESFVANVFSQNWISTLIDSEGNNESLFISNVGNAANADTSVYLNIQSFDSECARVVGPFNAIEKQGFPEGFGELNRIERDQNIKYRIRFQNTNNTVINNVTVLDFLSEYLDYLTVIPGASSHPYTFTNQENIIEFRFNNINLPPSSINEQASIGFVEFHIKQRPTNPISYTIENQASVYFDYNSPEYTPIHRYSIYPAPLGLEGVNELKMNLSPNPSTGLISLNFTEKWQGIQKTIQISDLSGRIIKTMETSESTPTFNWNELPNGTYIISVKTKNGLGASARWTKI